MRVILGGKFESAVIRAMDALNQPDRNRTTHHYYMGLNRPSDPAFFERVGTFAAIAEEILVPVADWSDSARGPTGLNGSAIGLRSQTGELNEWDEATCALADVLLENDALSADSLSYISEVAVEPLPDEDRGYVVKNLDSIRHSISVHYLCRLFLQIREAQAQRAFLVLDERDIMLASEIRDFLVREQHPLSFPFPDMDCQVILGHKFAGGLFNFAPHDASSVAAIRADAEIQRYAKRVRAHVASSATIEGERALVEAMRSSYEIVRKERKVEKAFEVMSWVVKPLHYIPGVDAVLTAAEDLKDVAAKLLDRDADRREWYLLAVRAQQIDIEDYLERRANL